MIRFSEDLPNENEKVPTQDDVVLALKKYGLESPEAEGVMKRWFEEKQRMVEQSGSVYSRLELNVEAAEIFFEAGLMQDSYLCSLSCVDIIQNEIKPEDMTEELNNLISRAMKVADTFL